MEGPFIVPFAWFFAMFCVLVYRGVFERVAAPDRAFERWIAEGPVLTEIRCPPGREDALAAAVRGAFGRRRSAVGTLGPLPFPHYRLRLSVEGQPGEGRIVIRGVRAFLLRPNHRFPGLLETLLPIVAGEAGSRVWADAGLYLDALDDERPAHGWTVEGGLERRIRATRATERGFPRAST
jgi:hypothetical protein